MAKKLKLQERRAVNPSRRRLAALLLEFRSAYGSVPKCNSQGSGVVRDMSWDLGARWPPYRIGRKAPFGPLYTALTDFHGVRRFCWQRPESRRRNSALG